MVPTVETCCCCIALRTGAIIIGVFFFITYGITILPPLRALQFLGKDENEDKENERQRVILTVYVLLLIIFGILLAIAGICIIVAACKYQPNLLKFATLFVLGYSISRFVMSWFFVYSSGNLISFIIDTMTFVIYLYLIVVLWSFYQEMLENEEEEEEEEEEDDY